MSQDRLGSAHWTPLTSLDDPIRVWKPCPWDRKKSRWTVTAQSKSCSVLQVLYFLQPSLPGSAISQPTAIHCPFQTQELRCPCTRKSKGLGRDCLLSHLSLGI